MGGRRARTDLLAGAVLLPAALMLLLAGAGSGALRAQELGVTQAPVVVLDTEQVFSATLIGRAIAKDLEEQVRALAAENKRIAAELEAEELALTEQRPTLPPAEFRALADAFDQKVQRIRAEQDGKQRALQRRREAERQSFLDDIAPILSQIAVEHGAVVILERRSVLLSASSIDITEEAIRRINAALNRRPEGADAPVAPGPAEGAQGAEGAPDGAAVDGGQGADGPAPPGSP